jgi:hypothetical protein
MPWFHKTPKLYFPIEEVKIIAIRYLFIGMVIGVLITMFLA